MTSSRPPRRQARAPLVILLVGLLLATPLAAAGTWTSQDTLATVSGSAGTVEAPPAVRCTTEGGVLGLAQYAVIAWDEPSSGAPDRYSVRAQGDGTQYDLAELDGSVREFEIRSGLLTGLLEALWGLIAGGGRPPVTVVAVHESGWVSAEAEPVAIRLGLLGLGGIRCA